jgi:hypothetical protein
MGWLAYIGVWLTFALVWTLAGSTSSGRPAIETLPYGLLAMGSAALMGIGIWRITGRVRPDWRSPAFYASHAAALASFCAIYATSWMWIDIAAGRTIEALQALRSSPVLLWNLLMGSWLYLMVAAAGYAVRTQQSLRAQETAAAEVRLLAQQAQLAALRAQINPHFLFNALHSVGALVATDPVLADRALERLGDMLRYALDAGDQVPLRQEWRFTTDYLALEQLRLGDRLQVDARVDDEAQSVLVPPLILQPLVENAVRHGIADRAEGGSIEIRAGVRGADLVLRVSDDGRGRHEPCEGSSGLGLDSVRNRLAAIYGGRATLRADRAPSGFSVAVALPAGDND